MLNEPIRIKTPIRLYQPLKNIAEVCITIVDDDGKPEVETKLYPLARQKGIPFVLALVPTIQNAVTQDKSLTYQRMGWEIASHGYNHIPISGLDENELETELVKSKEALESIGYNVSNLIWPYGQRDSNAIQKATQVYSSAGKVGGGVNLRPLNNYELNRVALGSYTGAGLNTLETYKARVDESIEKSAWLIFMTHCGAEEHDETQQQHLSDTIEYAKQKGIRIVSMQEGLEAFS